MVHYKLTYFNSRGLAEATRQIFVLAGVEFEDVRLDHLDGSWEKLKPTTPFGFLPLLEVDGFVIPQSAAQTRYLARKFGFAGKTPEEEAWADAIVDQFKDYIGAFREVFYAERFGKSPEEVAKIRKETAEPALQSFLAIITKILEKSKSGFLVGGGLTWADLVVAENLYSMAKHNYYIPADHPKLAEFQKKIASIPKLKDWIAKRPETPF